MPSDFPKLSPRMNSLIEKGTLDRLPVTFSAFWFEQIRDWDLLFPAEKDYYERLFSLLDRSDRAAIDRLFEPIRAIEVRMGVNAENWPRHRFTLDQLDFLNRNQFGPHWRSAIRDIFARIDPVLDEEIARNNQPRLAVILAPADLPVSSDRMWTRLRKEGLALTLEVPENPQDYLPLLLTGSGRAVHRASIADLYVAANAGAPYTAWMIEATDSLSSIGLPERNVVHCGYLALEQYRKRLMSEVDGLLREQNVRGPRELSARLKQLKVRLAETELAQDAVLAEFVRATLLQGNGTLLLNNTFVEWASIQAVRRARPFVHIVSFGIRNKLKPFSSVLLYADQDAVSPIPTQTDVLGSYVDLEILYLYVWQEFRKYPEYRNSTVYVFAADGMDQTLVIAPTEFLSKFSSGSVSLAKVHTSMKEWLGIA
jgi:hypothetical protein